MNRTLSIQEWSELAAKGTALPVRIPIMGYSMFPLIRYKKDPVTIIPLDTLPQIGDIVLFAAPNSEKYVVHRVWDLKGREVLTWGDNCPGPDIWLPLESVLGKVILIERGRFEIHPDPVKGMKLARFWHKTGKYYRSYKRYRDAVMRRIKKIVM